MRKLSRSQKANSKLTPPSKALSLLLGLMTAALVLSFASLSQAQIKSPGSHVRYDAELEPHGLIVWDGPVGLNDGFGLGLRASIPLFHNGPIKKINNNMAIGFGLDFSFYDNPCGGVWRYRYRGDVIVLGRGVDCSAWSIWLPVVLQWNFYVTDLITVFGEPGFAISHTRVSWDGCLDNNVLCDGSDSETNFHPFVLFGGAKFMFGRSVGLTVRIGYPYLSVGASFLF